MDIIPEYGITHAVTVCMCVYGEREGGGIWENSSTHKEETLIHKASYGDLGLTSAQSSQASDVTSDHQTPLRSG